MSFVLAHFSDVHLGPLPKGAPWRDFALKRIIGGASWTFNRRKINDPKVAAALLKDIHEAKPDHVAFTGDLINIASKPEFVAGAAWLRVAGPSDWLSMVPGNHDAYVPMNWDTGLGHFASYMIGDMPVEKPTQTTALATPFPYVRLRRNIAIIGLNTGIAQPLFKACGALGHGQLAALGAVLKSLRERGFYRAVMLHHPPLVGLAPAHKSLQDAAALQEILSDVGAELVLHGHNHHAMQSRLTGRSQTTAVFGVASASSNGYGDHEPASWNRYAIARSGGKWTTLMTSRIWHAPSNQFIDGPSVEVTS